MSREAEGFDGAAEEIAEYADSPANEDVAHAVGGASGAGPAMWWAPTPDSPKWGSVLFPS